jgi:hypothetical protein
MRCLPASRSSVEYEGADGTPPYEDLYFQIDGIQREFERRGAPRALVALYTHADVRVRALAAQWTMSTAPELARDRLAAIDDENWSRLRPIRRRSERRRRLRN